MSIASCSKASKGNPGMNEPHRAEAEAVLKREQQGQYAHHDHADDELQRKPHIAITGDPLRRLGHFNANQPRNRRRLRRLERLSADYTNCCRFGVRAVCGTAIGRVYTLCVLPDRPDTAATNLAISSMMIPGLSSRLKTCFGDFSPFEIPQNLCVPCLFVSTAHPTRADT